MIITVTINFDDHVKKVYTFAGTVNMAEAPDKQVVKIQMAQGLILYEGDLWGAIKQLYKIIKS